MFFVWIAFTLFLYLSSVLLFLKDNLVAAITLLIVGILSTLTFFLYYAKRRNKKERLKKDSSNPSSRWDCYSFNCGDCFDVPRWFHRGSGAKAGNEVITTDVDVSAVSNGFGGGKADLVGHGAGSGKSGECAFPFDCDSPFDCDGPNCDIPLDCDCNF